MIDELTKLAAKEKYGDEEVFVVPRNFCVQIPDHFSFVNRKLFRIFFHGMLPKGHFILRYEAEGESAFQQIIPYIVVTDDEGRYFVSKRLSGDNRLVRKLSLGFGGHINPCDCIDIKDRKAMLQTAMKRELEEETSIRLDTLDTPPELIGFIRNINSSLPDHIGAVYRVNIGSSHPRIIEKDNLEGIWMRYREMTLAIEEFEAWAQFIIAAKAYESEKQC